MNINGDCKDELPEDGSIFNWPFNPKNDDITKMWAYAYCPADDIDCPPLTVKQDKEIFDDLNVLTRDEREQPLTCKKMMCKLTEIFNAITKECIPCGDYQRAQGDGTVCGPDVCSELERVQKDGDDAGTCIKCDDYKRG